MRNEKAGDGNRTHMTSLEGWGYTFISTCNSNNLQNCQFRRAAHNTALSLQSDRIDPDLQALIEAWPNLPQAICIGILAIIKVYEQ
jgi:hypothetical protein